MAKQIYKSLIVVLLILVIAVKSYAQEKINNIYLPFVIKEEAMTQISRPQQGRLVTYPDAGGYTANQWARIMRVLATDPTTEGPFYSHLDGLEVTNPAGVTIRVASGMGLVNGHFLMNENQVTPTDPSNVDFTPTTPGADRDDIVVMVQNNTDAAYDGTPDYGGAVLEFPVDLTDYEATASVPPHSCRLAILTGVSGGAARLLTQDISIDGDIWMVELATYTISNVPAISALTDTRDFVDAETHYLFVNAKGGMYDDAPNVDLEFATASISLATQPGGLVLPDGEDSTAWGNMVVPANYIKDLISTPLVIVDVGVNGNCYCSNAAGYGVITDNPPFNGGVDTTGVAAVAIDANSWNPIQALTLATPTIGDAVLLEFFRESSNVLDTVGAEVRLQGWYITYFGWKR